MKRSVVVGGLCAMAVSTVVSANQTVTFAGFSHGRILTQGASAYTDGVVSVRVDNFNRAFDIGAVFDSTISPALTSDDDLLDPWDMGNLSNPQVVLGNLLIIAENNAGAGSGTLTDPDDEAGRPAGEFIINFSQGATAFGFDIVDVEGTLEENGMITLFAGAVSVGSIPFASFTNPMSGFFDPTIDFGNNSANRITPFAASGFGVPAFDRVVIRMGGSGAIDNLVYVPAPGAAAVLGLGLLAASRRRRA